MLKIVLFLVIYFVIDIQTEPCITPYNEKAECVSLYACPLLLQVLLEQLQEGRNFVRRSHCGMWTNITEPSVCCGSNAPTPTPPIKNLSLSDRALCGFQHTDDYFYTGNVTAIDEFPWLAIFKYERYSNLNGEFMEFGCAGTLINARYVLTAAQCLTPSIIVVRLGEYNLRDEIDCVKFSNLDDCGNPVEDVKIEEIIKHPKYDRNKGLNDIALIRLGRTIEFTEFIRPICLPIDGIILGKIGDRTVASGFGRASTNGEHTIIKKRILGKLISNEECEKHFSATPNQYGRVTENIICSLETNSSLYTGCEGDAGGPLTFSHRAQWHIEGVAVWSTNQCRAHYPFAYTRVVNYLDWIEQSIKSW